MTTRVATSDFADALVLLRDGELVAFPTETVYGIGADARRDDAVARIFAAKGRPKGNPVIVHVADIAAAQPCVAQNAWSDRAQSLAEKFWPGPFTMILPRGAGISALVSAGRSTVAIRCPDHPVAQRLLREFDGPIAAPSANRSGFTSPTTAAHVLAELNGRIPLILDGGPCRVGLESTVLDLSSGSPRILRPGAVTADMIEAVIGHVETVAATVSREAAAESPGQHDRHYAPRTPAHLFTRSEWPKVQRKQQKIALITHDPNITLSAPREVFLLPADPESYARTLYAALREADEKNANVILILQPESTEGLWLAILDRLRRATTPLS